MQYRTITQGISSSRTRPRVRYLTSSFLLLCFCLGSAYPATFQSFEFQDANTLPGGQIDLMLSLSYFQNYVPQFSTGNDQGTLYEIPRIGANFGVTDNVEIQVDWAMLRLNSPVHKEYGIGDVRVFTKINFLKENGNMPAMGVHFGVKVPSADDRKGLGTNRTDIFVSGLVTKGFGSITAHLNLGWANLDVPNAFTGQDDMLSFNAAIVIPVVEHLNLVTEIAGQTHSEENNDQARIRVGLQYFWKDLTLDTSIAAGLNKNTEDYQIGAGLTYHWKAF